MGKDETVEAASPAQQEEERATEESAPVPNDTVDTEAGGKNAKKRAMQFDFQAMFAQTIQSAKSKGADEEPHVGPSLRVSDDDGEELAGGMRAPKFSLASSGETSGVEEGEEDDADDVGPALPPGFRPAAGTVSNAADGEDDAFDEPVSLNLRSNCSFQKPWPLSLASSPSNPPKPSTTPKPTRRMSSPEKSDESIEELSIEGQEFENEEEEEEEDVGVFPGAQ